MENLLLALSIAKSQVSDLEWMIEQTTNRLRREQDLLSLAVSMVKALESAETEMKFAKAKSESLQSHLDRWEEKNRLWAQSKVNSMELPQHQTSYWKIEGPKLQQKVLDLEQQLEYYRSKSVWKE